MITSHTVESLQAFEQSIADDFNAGKIRAPVHLSGGGEQELIELFEHIQPQDWIFSAWRSHYHCLLKGVSPVQLREDIRNGRSITLCYPEYRIFTTAILAGQFSIALGTALAIKRCDGLSLENAAEALSPHVWVFAGDMTCRTGAFHEAIEYASGHSLPISFVLEDNGRSVRTNTRRAWGENNAPVRCVAYQYAPLWPHSGTGKWVEF